MATSIWTQDEFAKLLLFPARSADSMTELLPGRSSGAISVVRAGIHANHVGQDDSMLSNMMKELISEPGLRAICPICKEVTGHGQDD